LQVRDLRIVRGLSAGELESRLTGRKFLSTRQHGKYLFAGTDAGQWLVMHFGMTGYLYYFEKPDEDPSYNRLLIRFETNGFLAYVNQRMFGWVGITPSPDELIEQKGLGPSALDPKLNRRLFRKIFSGRKGEIKPALMDQGLIAGIGNIYSDEILFQARIHPKRKVGDLREAELGKIFNKTREVLRTAVDRNARVDDLPPGYLFRSRRKGAACPVCGTRLQTMKVGGRTSCFCSKCQKRNDE